jgi:tetratricopeptide (TPR) repeat protein
VDLRGNGAKACSACAAPRAGQVAPRLRVCSACGHIDAIAGVEHVEVLDSVSQLAPGTELRGRYRLVHVLGHGGHGVTYLANHLYLRHNCVVKILRLGGGRSDAGVRRMRAEAALGLQLSVPSLIRVLDFDCEGDDWFFVMEYVAGIDLGRALRIAGRLNWKQAAALAIDVCDALTAIHAAGLVHGDIKPSNLMLDLCGRVRVGDLGLASPADESDAAGPRGFTLPYAAPEIFAADTRVDHRSDFYSLGATLFEALTGAPLVRGDSTIWRALLPDRDGPAWPADAPTDTPDWLKQLTRRLLAGDPADRFDSAAEISAILAAALGRSARIAEYSRPSPAPPRGILVTGFQPLDATGPRDAATDAAPDFAFAESLGRHITTVPGVYMPDRAEFAGVLERVRRAGPRRRSDAIVEAGRLVGAAVMIQGYYRQSEETIEFFADLIQSGKDTLRVGPVSGVAGHWPSLLAQLFERIREQLRLSGAASPPGLTAPDVAAQERFFSGRQAYLRGDYEEAARLGREALTLAPEFGEAVGFVGVCAAKMGRYDEAAEYHLRQAQIAERQDDPRLAVESQANMGAMHYFRGEYEAALTYFLRASQMAENSSQLAVLAKIRNNLGFVYLHLARLPDAEAAYRGALAAQEEFGGGISMIGPYNGLGNVLREQGRAAEAVTYHRRSLLLAQEADDHVNIGVAHTYLGRCAAELKRFDEAKHHLAIAVTTLEGTRFWNGLARTYECIADTNIRLGHAEEAIRCAERRRVLAARHANRRMEAAACRQLAVAHRQADRLAAAQEWEDRAEELSQQPRSPAAVA